VLLYTFNRRITRYKIKFEIMIKIKKKKKKTTFEIIGLNKLWAFKSEIKIPNDHIIKAYQDETKIKDWYMVKLNGTNMSYVLNAGTFYQDGGINTKKASQL
jgi:hypothetical protein